MAFVAKSSRSVVVPKLKKAGATAKCPAGEHVSSGGLVAQFHPPVGSGPLVFPTGMRRTAANKWTVYGQSGEGFIGSRLTAIAYCDRGAVPSVAEKTVKLPGYGLATAIATCPAGSVVVGGGYNAGASVKQIPLVYALNRLGPNQWFVSMINAKPTATTVTAIAYCGHGAAPTEVAATSPLGPKKGGTARVSCPAGKSIVFGGVAQVSPVVAKLAAAVTPFSWSAASTKQWVVTGYNIGTTAGQLIAVAYCR